MKTTIPQLLLVFTGAATLLSASGQNQEPTSPTAPAPPEAHLSTSRTVPAFPIPIQAGSVRFNDVTEQKRVDAHMSDMPLTEVVAWLERNFPDVNFVRARSLAQATLPVTLRLRAVGLRDILEAINIATDGAVTYEVRSPRVVALRPKTEEAVAFSPSSGFSPPPYEAVQGPRLEANTARNVESGYGTGVSTQGHMVGGMGGGMSGAPGAMAGMGGMGGGVYELPPRKAAGATLPAYQVINLREILRVDNAEKIREMLNEARMIAMEAASGMAEGSRELQTRLTRMSVNYHEGSGVLVLIGQPEAIKLTMDVIRNLRVQKTAGSDKTPSAEQPSESK